MCDLFIILEETDFASYADNNTPFVSSAAPENVVSFLETCSTSLFEWREGKPWKMSFYEC